MKNPFEPLSDLYEKMLLSEAEKSNLQNPSADEVGDLKTKQDFFGSKPKVVEGPDKAKLDKGPSYKETTGSTSSPKATKTEMPKSSPAKETKVEKGEEMKDTEVDPTDDEKEETEPKHKKNLKEENFTMSAFDTLFRKTINEEVEDEVVPSAEEGMSEEGSMEDMDMSEETEAEEETEEELEEEEGDLISDLRDLQDRLASILDKLEDVQAQEEEHEEHEEGYSEEEFDEEFGDEDMEESSVKESMDKPKPLNSSKGKVLMSKKNKVGGKLHAKGGKAYSGSLKHEPKPKALGDKKGSLQKGKPVVKSTVTKGDFIK